MTDAPLPPDLEEAHIDAEIAEADAFAAAALAAPSWCHVYPHLPDTDPAAVFEFTGRVTRKVRGRKMPTWDRLYDEFAAAWQFGDFFGENRYALDDCMRTLNHQLPTDQGYVLLIFEPEELLAEVPRRAAETLADFVENLKFWIDEYAEAIPGPEGDLTARPALPFDVVLVTDRDHREGVIAAWQAAGAPLEHIT